MEKKILKQVPVFMPYVLHVFYKDLLQIYFLITKHVHVLMMILKLAQL